MVGRGTARRTPAARGVATPPAGLPYHGPIIDVHTHPMLPGGPRMGAAPHRPADYRRGAAGLDLRAVAALTMAPRGDPTATRRQNDQVLALARGGAVPFYPVCSVHPLDGPEALPEIDRVAAAGARGLKLHPNTQQFDVADPAVTEVVRRAAEHGLPVLFDAWSPFDADQPGKFVQLAITVPSARLVLAHAHGPRFPDLLVYEVLARYDWWRRNVWIDLSAIAPLLAGGPYAPSFEWVLRKVGVDRLLYGSDYPLYEPRDAVAAMASYGFTAAERRRIFFENARRLYRLPAATSGRR